MLYGFERAMKRCFYFTLPLSILGVWKIIEIILSLF